MLGLFSLSLFLRNLPGNLLEHDAAISKESSPLASTVAYRYEVDFGMEPASVDTASMSGRHVAYCSPDVGLRQISAVGIRYFPGCLCPVRIRYKRRALPRCEYQVRSRGEWCTFLRAFPRNQLLEPPRMPLVDWGVMKLVPSPTRRHPRSR